MRHDGGKSRAAEVEQPRVGAPAVLGDVVEGTAWGACSGPAMAVGETVEATFVELCRQAAPRDRVLPRCRGASPWWPRSLTRQDLAPTVSVRRGETLRRGWGATVSGTLARGAGAWGRGRLPRSMRTSAHAGEEGTCACRPCREAGGR
jgi:hypothetical protein